MSQALASYGSGNVTFIFGGVPISGFSDGTHINIELDGEGVTVRNGNDGAVGRALSPRRTATITGTLMQTSTSNAYLLQCWALDQATHGRGVLPIVIENLSGGELFASAAAWIIKPPSTPFSAAIENREWKFQAFMADITKFFGSL